MDLAIVIATHNQNNLRLKNCIRTFLYQETTHSYGIYIIDYASTDNLRPTLEELGSDKIFYLHVDKEPLNKAHANNIALKVIDADIICVTDGYCIVPMQTVEYLCTETKDDTLLLYVRRPYFIPENLWSDSSITPADYERLRTADTQWLDENMAIGLGPHKKRLFAARRQRFIEINGYDESLAYDEDVDIVRRLLQHGCILTDLSLYIDAAYQPSQEDWIAKPIQGPLKKLDMSRGEAHSALWRKDPRRNLNQEWGVL